MTRSTDSSRAFMMLDALIGLMIVGALGLILATAVGTQYRAQQKLADLRAANRFAERILLNLQHGQSPPTLPSTDVKMHPINGGAPKGYTWTAVEVTVRGRNAILYGIVPAPGGAR
jgi:type II secretory pathway pseudopilin PulG